MTRFQEWLNSISVESTRRTYREHLTRLFNLAGLNPDEALDKMLGETQRFETYVRLIGIAKAQRPSVERLMTFGLRRYLQDNGMLILPRSRIQQRPRSIVHASITWEQAITICNSASRPYSMIFRTMLHCGWGAGEWLRFNTAETWRQVKRYLGEKNGLPYFRYDFAGRKTNVKEWYSMIPRFILEEFVKAVEVPVRARSQNHQAGIPLDVRDYRTVRLSRISVENRGAKITGESSQR